MLRKTMQVLAVILVGIFGPIACGGKSAGGDTRPEGRNAVSPGAGPVASADGITFSHKPDGQPSAVFLAGSFNGWKPDDPNYALEDVDGDGSWEITIALDPGSYEYKFVVDGTWCQDKSNPQANPDPYGGFNSVLEVR